MSDIERNQKIATRMLDAYEARIEPDDTEERKNWPQVREMLYFNLVHAILPLIEVAGYTILDPDISSPGKPNVPPTSAS